MPELNASSMLASEDRLIGLRTRSDLVIQESVYQGETCWIVKDPLAMKYFRIRAPEHLVLQELRGATNYNQLKSQLSKRFPEHSISPQALQQLVVSLHRNGLLVTNAVGQAKPLQKRRNKELRQKALGLMSSLISMRFPGVDPDPALNWLYPKCRWFFSYWFTAIVFATGAAAAGLVLANLDQFYARLPDFQSFFAFDNIMFMGLVLIFTKSIHELGHGLMCKHFGGECHEIGFMLLVLTPAMFCNTSDSWVLPNRWHRIAIGAAGMYVELFMASICTFIWWYTHPGWLHYFCLNLMFLSSTSTVIFNINPLLRYDGYYMLSDFLEIPNLSQKSNMALLSRLRTVCLGMKPVNFRLLPQRHHELFAVYSIASFVYRWMVMIFIFWFVAEIFEPWGLAAVGHIVIAVSLFGMIGVPLWKLYKFFTYPGRMREVKRAKFIGSLIVVSLVMIGLFVIPFPHHVEAKFVLQPMDPQRVVVTQPGNLRQATVTVGDQVSTGQIIAELENAEIDLRLEALMGELARMQDDLSAYRLTRNQYLDSGKKIEETIAMIVDLEKKIELTRLQQSRLKLVANRNGQILPAPNRLDNESPPGQLGSWLNTPLDPENRHSYLEANTLVCLVGDPNQFHAILVVNESDLPLLAPGQRVVMLLDGFSNEPFASTVSYVAKEPLEEVPRELSQTHGGPLAVKPDGSERPLLTSFEVRADVVREPLARQDVFPIQGLYGQAKVRVGDASIAHQCIRYLRTLINFR